MSWKILIIMDNVYKGFSFIFCVMIVTLILIATFQPHTAGLHQLIVSSYWCGPDHRGCWGLVYHKITNHVHGRWVSIQITLLVLWEEETDPSAVHCDRDQLSCCRHPRFRNLNSSNPSVVSDLKTDHMPCCWRQWQSGSDKPLMYCRTTVELISSVPTTPKIWKRYVDDIFTTLKRNVVKTFLQHFSTQQPSIHFTMETENDNTIPFLDTLVIKDSEGCLTTSVYRKPMHTDQYLSYDSHHPQSVKRSVVKCLYDGSKNIITKPLVISEEKKH